MIIILTIASSILLALALYAGQALGNSCTDSCNAAYSGGIAVTMCGTDFATYSSHSQAFYDNTCYDLCGIMSQYAGSCGCPNNCYQDLGQGSCALDGTSCECKSGWGGRDCSLPVSLNKCSLHGKLLTPGDKDSVFDFDYCQCDEGFTGVDCSSPVPNIGRSAPWGTVFDDVQVWYNDDYKDDHPVWNVSVFATIRVEIEVSDYINLLLPVNLYNESYAPATIHFDNGHVRETLPNAGIHVKGQGSRIDQKKGWSIKFNEFVKGQKLVGVEKIGLKGCSEDDSHLKSQLTTELMRSVGVPTQRSSYALLYIDDVFIGLYFMHENFDTTFLKSRYSGDGSGNLMQLYFNVHMGYYGDDETYYRDRVHVNALGYPMHYYTMAEGDDSNWGGFISWLKFVNASSDEEFEAKIGDYLDTRNFLRTLVVESFMLSSDNLAGGNNVYMYQQSGPGMTMFTYDFESVFQFDSSNNEPLHEPDIFDFFTTFSITNYDDINPLLNRLLVIPKYNSTYLSYYRTFIDSVFGSNTKQVPSMRFTELYQFILPWIKRDKLWELSYGITIDRFMFAAQQTIANLPKRYMNVSSQLDMYQGLQ